MSYGSYMRDMASGCYPAMSLGDWANAPWNDDEEPEYMEVNAYFTVGIYDRDTDTEYEVQEDVLFDNILDNRDDKETYSQVFDEVGEYCKNKYKGKDYDYFNLKFERS